MRYGLSLLTPLVSKYMSTIASKTAMKNLELGKWEKNNKFTKGGKRPRISKESYRYNKSCAMYRNKHGTCEAQLEHRFEIAMDILGKEDPTIAEIKKYDSTLAGVIEKRYNRSMTKFKQKYGYTCTRVRPRWDRIKLIAAIRKVAKDLGRIPVSRDFKGKSYKGLPSPNTITIHLGSFNRARVIALGLDKRR